MNEQFQNEQWNQTDPEKKSGNFLIVGIGASAGGIEALQAFFAHVSAKSNAAYVVILHLSPDHDSQLAQLLQQATALPVLQVKENTLIERDHIYVISPNIHLAMADGYLIPSINMRPEDRMAPVDIFFRTLAEAQRAAAVGVILSGTGANGSMGLKRIKEQGGAVFVQNPREAAFNEMPRNAIATGFVDEVLNVAELPAHILNYGYTLTHAYIPEDAAKRDEEAQQALREIFTQLRLRTGHDFINYKRATLMRRIERRMAVRGLAELPQYAAFSNEHPEEIQALLKDLLISVTNFFRDKPAFDVLEAEVLPALFEGRTSEDQVRIWVPGCATGEEAYTIAMLCAERTLGLVDVPKVQIFATDIDEAAIATAREGFYTLNDAADVSAERLSRFFTREGEHYRIRRELRETILFAHHNFLKDPPFSRIDLVSCRNVLIYLNRQAQERVMETFHFALRPAGFLLLGTSESVDTASDLFKSFNREQHIFQSCLSVNQRPIIVPDSIQPLRLVPVPNNMPAITTPRTSYGDLHFRLLEEYAPPSVVVNAEFDLLHTSPRAGRYLQMAGGEPTQAVLKLIREELRSELRNGLYQAIQKNTPVTSLPLYVRTEDGTEHIRIHIRPIQGNEEGKNGFLLVIFQPAIINEEQEQPIVHTGDETAARHLEDELARLRMLLRASNEQHEFQAEELKAGNEELQAMNEELRSATEELETNKEELQSINEELSTVNQELKVKVEEATMISNNLQNLINSTDIGTIFLDRSLRVVLFTPAVRTVFNLIPADYGRPLSDITSKLEVNTVLEDAQVVLEQLQRIEREAKTVDGRTVLVRLSPYRSEEDRIQGVVISLLDITARKKADEAIRISEEKYRTIFETIDEGFCIFEVIYDNNEAVDLKWIEVNPAYEKQMGLKDTIGKLASDVIPGTVTYWLEIYNKVVQTGEAVHFESWHEPTQRWYNTIASRIGGAGSHQVTVLFADITKRKRREQHQEFLLNLSDTLRVETGVEAVGNRAVQMIAGQLGADRVYLVTLIPGDDNIIVTHETRRSDMPPLQGTYRGSDFPAALREIFERTIVYNDVRTDERLTDLDRLSFSGLGAVGFMAASIRRGGEAMIWAAGAVSTQPRSWTEDEITLFEDAIERTWAAVERAKAEEALRESEEKYRSLFESIDEGFALVEVFPDERGRVTDMIWREANPGVERHAGMSGWVGKRASEIVPNLEQEWLDAMTGVYQTGEPVRTEAYIADLDRWIDTYYSRVGRPGSQFIAAVFQDITGRKRREARLAFLAEIAEDFSLLSSADEIMQTVGAKIGAYLQITTCNFADVHEEYDRIIVHNGWSAPSVPSTVGTFQLSKYLSREFERASRAGETVVIRDTQTDPRTDTAAHAALDIYSFVTVPFLKGNRWTHIIAICDSRPRNWSEDEIELIEEVSNRIFPRLERARAEDALRINEDRIRGQKEAFQAAVNGVSLPGAINLLARLVNQETKGEARTAFYIANEEGTHLHPLYGAGDMPSDFLDQVTGLPIGEDARSGVLAIPQSQPVITPDVLEEPLWQAWTSLAEAFDYRGCWSFPIQTRDNKGVGTFAMYFRTAREATPRDLALADIVTRSAAMIIASYMEAQERLRAEGDLRISEERYRTALESADMAAWDWNIVEDKISWNDQHFLLLGLIPEQRTVNAAFFMQFVHPDDLSAVGKELDQAVRESGVFHMDMFRIIQADGTLRWMTGHGSVVSREDGRATRMTGVMYDITERKLLEQQKDQFIGIASHELRTPVTSIKAYAEILEELFRENGDTESAGLMHKLDEQVDRLTSLIYALLDTTRITEGKLQLEKALFDMTDLLTDALDTMQRISGNHRIELDIKKKAIVFGDRERIRQVVENLIGNAIKYSPDADRVIVYMDADNEAVKICVQDFGIGISEKGQLQLFNRFFRDDEAGTYPGIGLGLLSAQLSSSNTTAQSL